MPEPENHLVRIFKDAAAHQEVAGIISRHLTSKMDIREAALDGLDLSKTRNILDLGCGFGFFTEGLKGKIPESSRITGIDCHPEYEWFFFQSCEKVDPLIRKKFFSSGVKELKKLEQASFDLVICSYALYFFPEVIGEIPRILKKDGSFIVITHATNHLHQFSEFVRKLLLTKEIAVKDQNPYEVLISRFSDRNGMELLSPAFNSICSKTFKSQLVFRYDDFEDFMTYLNFKHSFFIPPEIDPDDRIHNMVLEAVKDRLEEGKIFEITKDDVIYICTDPVDSL